MPAPTESKLSQEQPLEVIIARLQPVGDNDLIASLLSSERGRVDAWVRAGRKASRRFGGRLELFRQGTARLRKGKGRLPSLVGLESAKQLLAPGASYGVLCLASYAAELALIAAQPEHADSDLATWLEHSLRLADTCDDDDLATSRLATEIAFLGAAGWLPSAIRCSQCGLDLAGGAAWPAFADGPVCARCAPGGQIDLDARSLATLMALRSGDPAAAPLAALSPDQINLLGERVVGLLHDALPRRPRSADALSTMT